MGSGFFISINRNYLKPTGLPPLKLKCGKWFFQHKKWVRIIPRDAYTFLEYHFFDKEGNEIQD